MEPLYSIDQLTQLVNTAIEKLTFPAEPRHLYDPIRYVLSGGGKRIRPVLMLMAYNLYKDKPEDIIQQAIALETYHNFTLLHDDVIDKSDLRRGRPTVHKKWNETIAILSGDTMLMLAYRMFGNNAAFKDFTEATLGVGEGEQLDIDFEERTDVTEAEYMEMIRLKTSFLLAYALKIGAKLAGADEEDQQNLYDFGIKMGLAFQVQDDLLDVYADTAVFQKKLGGDIVENKKTYLLIQALQKANAEQKAELDAWIAKTECNQEEKIAAVTHIYNNIGIPAITQRCIETLFEESHKSLDKVKVSENRKAELRTFAKKLLGRKY
ncbi:MAG: polyprenyl synthetase family protein [Bacteroidaceae bacterium]|nr:polyprenyl synthetase family protein [Bacteroidaceae bacterium]